jgi:hypothetical protein
MILANTPCISHETYMPFRTEKRKPLSAVRSIRRDKSAKAPEGGGLMPSLANPPYTLPKFIKKSHV